MGYMEDRMNKEKCCCRYKATKRSPEEIKALTTRVNRIAGQLSGIAKMIENNRYCDDVLIQLAAVDKAVRSLATVLLEDHMRTCLVEDIQQGNLSSVDEIVDLFRRFQ